MTIQETITKAIEGGWKPPYQFTVSSISYKVQALNKVKFKERFFLDPLFWQALGKALGWEDDWGIGESRPRDDIEGKLWRRNCTRWHWHRFIDHLAGGGNVDDFFKDL